MSREADAALDAGGGGVFIANNDVCVRVFVGFVKRVHLKRPKYFALSDSLQPVMLNDSRCSIGHFKSSWLCLAMIWGQTRAILVAQVIMFMTHLVNLQISPHRYKIPH